MAREQDVVLPPDQVAAVLRRISAEMTSGGPSAMRATVGGLQCVNMPERKQATAMSPRDLALIMYRRRRARDHLFEDYPGLFGEPVWDMLLYLYADGERAANICVSSACFAANVPQTTALRCVARLEEFGLVKRRDDPMDRRRKFVELTERGNQLMESYIETVRRRLDREGPSAEY